MLYGQPVLIGKDNSVFSRAMYVRPSISRPTAPFQFSEIVPSPSVNLARGKTLKAIEAHLRRLGSPIVLVVGAGRQKQDLASAFSGIRGLRLVCTDIAPDADADIYCDAHELPFLDDSFDALITTAVLEHVMYPERVAGELHRVLKMDGVIYSEFPFMQQVHEGAFDFSRMTLSGHRRLLNRFAEIDAGIVAGPGTALVWSIEYFLLAFVRGRLLQQVTKAVARIAFFWLKYFDYLVYKSPAAADGASCTYFLGRKQRGTVPDAEIIRAYRGS